MAYENGRAVGCVPANKTKEGVSYVGSATCLVNGGDDLEQLVIRQVLERELALRHVPGVGFPEHGVPVSGDHLTR